jgi:6-phosphofructokinase 1
MLPLAAVLTQLPARLDRALLPRRPQGEKLPVQRAALWRFSGRSSVPTPTVQPLHLSDFTIRTLGAARYVSPLQLAQADSVGQAEFTSDQDRLLFHEDWEVVRGFIERSEQPPTLELAGPRERLYFRPADVRAAIVTAGGLCPGINDVVRSLVMTLSHHYGVHEIVGIRYGLRGFVSEDSPPLRMTPELVKSIHREGGSLLGSSRGTPPVAEIVKSLQRQAINVLFMVGGDGTQRAAKAIALALREAGTEIAVIGIPKTIDNDILYVDQTFGFSTAVSLARQAIDAAHAEAHGAFNGVGLVRLMGRDAGFIAAQAALASGEANFVLVPEVHFELDGPNGVLAHLHRRLMSRKHALMVVAEGAGQQYLATELPAGATDASGNAKLGDIGRLLRSHIEKYFREKELSVAVRYIDPGYTIRSAPADASDSVYCQEMGQNAVHAAMAGKTDMLVGRVRGRQVHVPIAAITGGRKNLDPSHPLWRAVLQSTGQPEHMVNQLEPEA